MGGGPRYNYPKYVWSPSGGWWQDNVNWRRNTMFAVGAMAVIGVTVAVWADHHVVEYDRSPDVKPAKRWAQRGIDPAA
eukprot:CAMPEP_0171484634 /NCGR_PEP_ID=MMETSP0958-20121227/109_1 /TAXON_ID=87120 /ORGANISM="Aurantiochytrium limacinum, Strain ATCCMYA-1381" /LENGTH=77 /DNA_ID=CAMNT_0012017355 /DNA_START=80 /DNA_END=313 /DNA_ORIENTATION=-